MLSISSGSLFDQVIRHASKSSRERNILVHPKQQCKCFRSYCASVRSHIWRLYTLVNVQKACNADKVEIYSSLNRGPLHRCMYFGHVLASGLTASIFQSAHACLRPQHCKERQPGRVSRFSPCPWQLKDQMFQFYVFKGVHREGCLSRLGQGRKDRLKKGVGGQPL